MKRPRIAILASNCNPIPPKSTAAAELIVSQITEGLVTRGFPVTLYAAGDAKTRARLVAVTKLSSIRDPHVRMENHKAYEFLLAARAYHDATKWGAKILLSHMAMVSGHFSSFVNFPSVALLHSPPTETDLVVMRAYSKTQKYISISNSQRRLAPGVRFVKTIYHGVNLKKLKFQAKNGSYLAFLGRIRDYKGAKEAIAVAKACKLPLRIAGPIDDQPYFDRFIRPALSRQIRYLGEIPHSQKAAFLGNAIATLFPISWDEPFGLVMVESLACGTPIIAFKHGSVPEVIKDKVNGRIVKNVPEMISAVRKVNYISRAACRSDATRRFSVDRMVDDYAELLTRLAKK